MSEFAKDEALLGKLASGQDDIWQQFYDDHRSPFRMFFLRYTRMNSEEVLALYHDVMVVMHRKVSSQSLQPPLRSSLRTYMFGIGKMLYRKQGQAQTNWSDEIPEVAVAPVIEDEAERKAQAAMVKGLLARLDEACRRILDLVYIKGYAMESVAAALDLSSEGAARKRKFDCLKKLRQMVEPK